MNKDQRRSLMIVALAVVLVGAAYFAARPTPAKRLAALSTDPMADISLPMATDTRVFSSDGSMGGLLGKHTPSHITHRFTVPVDQVELAVRQLVEQAEAAGWEEQDERFTEYVDYGGQKVIGGYRVTLSITGGFAEETTVNVRLSSNDSGR